MIDLFFFERGDDEMYRDIAPNLPKIVLLDTPTGLKDFQSKLDNLEILGIEVQVATAEILDQLRNREDGLFNLAYSSYEMLSDDNLISELGNEVQTYVSARELYGINLFQELVRQGLYVNGILYYQLRHIDQNTLILEKLHVPLTDHELHNRRITRQADLAGSRVVSAFNARASRI